MRKVGDGVEECDARNRHYESKKSVNQLQGMGC